MSSKNEFSLLNSSKIFSSNNIEVEIKEKDFKLYFDAIDKSTDKRYISEIKIPSGFSKEDLINSFEEDLYKITKESEDKLKLEITYVNESKKKVSIYILNLTDNPTPGQLFQKDPQGYMESIKSLSMSKIIKGNLPLNQPASASQSEYFKTIKSEQSDFYKTIKSEQSDYFKTIKSDHSSVSNEKEKEKEENQKEKERNEISHIPIPAINESKKEKSSFLKAKREREKKIKEPEENNEKDKSKKIKFEPPTPYDIEDQKQALFNLELLKNKDLSVWERLYITNKELENIIKVDQKNKPEAFVQNDEIEADIIQNKEESQYLPIAVLKGILEENGVNVVVEKQSSQPELSRDLLQMVVSGLGFLPVYEFHTDYGEAENFAILRDNKRKIEFRNKWKEKLSNLLKIPKEDIIVAQIRKGSLKFDVFLGKRLSDEEINLIKEKFKDELVGEGIKYLGILLKNCKLSLDMFYPKYNNYDHWAKKNQEKRGGEVYDSPEGWRGFALMVKDKYDNGDNTWIGHLNKEGEFCVAYHGVGQNAREPLELVGTIANENLFRAGTRQKYADAENIKKPGEKCGIGAYFTPSIEKAGCYAGMAKVNDKIYKAVFMCRVDPKKIREPRKHGARYWILSGKPDEVRPYRILLLEVENK